MAEYKSLHTASKVLPSAVGTSQALSFVLISDLYMIFGWRSPGQFDIADSTQDPIPQVSGIFGVRRKLRGKQ